MLDLVIHYPSLGFSDTVENRGRRPQFSTLPLALGTKRMVMNEKSCLIPMSVITKSCLISVLVITTIQSDIELLSHTCDTSLIIRETPGNEWQNLSKMYYFFTKIQNLPEINQVFYYILFTFFKNLPEMKEKSP